MFRILEIRPGIRRRVVRDTLCVVSIAGKIHVLARQNNGFRVVYVKPNTERGTNCLDTAFRSVDFSLASTDYVSPVGSPANLPEQQDNWYPPRRRSQCWSPIPGSTWYVVDCVKEGPGCQGAVILNKADVNPYASKYLYK